MRKRALAPIAAATAFAIGFLPLVSPSAKSRQTAGGGSVTQTRRGVTGTTGNGTQYAAGRHGSVAANDDGVAAHNRATGTTRAYGDDGQAAYNRYTGRGAAVTEDGAAAVSRHGAVAVGEDGAAAAGRYGAVAVSEEGAAAVGRYGGVYYGESYESQEAWKVAAGIGVGIAIGTMLAKPPAASTTVVVSNTTYYYSGGAYYEPVMASGSVSYQVVAPPPGAIITTLPTGCTTVSSGGVAYTQCGPTSYQKVSTGYQVVVIH